MPFIDLNQKRKKSIIYLLIVALVAAGVIIWIGHLARTGKIEFGGSIGKRAARKTEEPEKGLVPRRLDGVLVDPSEANFWPVAVMIDNMTTARPHSGLDKAGLIYEALVEGGCTRFMAVFEASQKAKEIGPVRSARPYFLDWVKELDALYAHCGGSNEALGAIGTRGIKDLDEITGGSRFFWRDRSRYAPHNLYTSSKLLDYKHAIANCGLADKKPTYESWKFKDDKPLEERPDEKKFIKINFSSISWLVEYNYQRENNLYLRSMGGKAHKDRITGKQYSAKNVVIQYVKARVIDAKGRLHMDTIGEGKALVFRDGEVIEGTWKKESRETRTKFYDKDGKEIEFNRGQTWIEIIPPDRPVEYN